MSRAASLVFVLALGPACARAEAPETAVVPPARTDSEEARTAAEPDGAEDARPALIPPGEMEERLAGKDPAATDDVPPAPNTEEDSTEAEDEELVEPEEPAGPPMREVLAETPEELAACLAELDRLGVAYEKADPITDPENPDCGMANPVAVTALADGVALDPPSEMRCATAVAGALWVGDVVQPLARKLGRGEVTAIAQGTAYLCRPRADGEMSEHAWGNALDVMGFRFSEGDPITVQPRAGDGTLDEAFQRAVQSGACLDFATVLGPGSDADHADHLHLDVKQRDGGYRICE